MADFSSMSDDQLLQALGMSNSTSNSPSNPTSNKTAGEMTNDELLSAIGKQPAITQSSRSGQLASKGTPLPANTPVRDNYSTQDEANFAESLGASAASFATGLANAPVQIVSDISNTIDYLSNKLGITSDEQFKKDIEYNRQRQQELSFQNQYTQRFPQSEDVGRGLGAIVPETVATSLVPAIPATSAAGRIGAATVQGATQGGLMGLLQGEPENKGQAAALGATLGGVLAGGGEAISQAISRAAAPGLSRADLEQQVQQQLGIQQQTGVQPTGQQLFGSPNARYGQAASQIQENVSPYISDITSVRPGTSLKTRGDLVTVFKNAEDAANSTSKELYSTALKSVDEASGPILPQTAIQASNNIKADIASNPGKYGKLAENSELIDFMNQIDTSGSTLPSGLQSIRRDIDTAIQTISRQKTLTNQESAMRKGLTALRQGLDNDITSASQASPQAANALSEAKQFWQDNVLALRNAGVEVDKGVSQYKVLTDFLKDPTKSDVAQKALNVLGPEGTQALKTNLASEAIEKSLNNTGSIDIAKFTKAYEKSINEYSLVYGDNDKALISGLSKVLESGGNISKQGTGLPEGYLKGMLDFVRNSKKGQDIIIGLGRLPKGSKEATEAANDFWSLIGKIRTAGSGELGASLTEQQNRGQ